MHKCHGCGALLQSNNKDQNGYAKDLSSSLCERCFRIRHYNEYKKINMTNDDFTPILKKINDTNDLVVLVVDLFCLPQDLTFFRKELHNDILLVLTKRDVLPRSLNDDKLLSYMDNFKLNEVDRMLISSSKNYQFDLLLEKIKQYKRSDCVYIVGFTNAGKSSMINRLIKNYTDNDLQITTSMLPSTTLEMLEIKIADDLTLVDTPGILESGSITEVIDEKQIKKIMPKKEIKPITYQMKKKQSLKVENFIELGFLKDTDITCYLSNALKLERIFGLKEGDSLEIPAGSDLVVVGLGFFRITKQTTMIVKPKKGVKFFIRKSLITMK